MIKTLLHRVAGLLAPREIPELSRNEPCHCGSGRKYKRCCLEKDSARLRSKREAGQGLSEDAPASGRAPANRTPDRADAYRPPKGRQP